MSNWFPTPRVTGLRGGPVLRWGVMAPGGIAEDFTAAVLANTDQRVVAVGSRSRARAEAFAQRHGIARAHDSYAALAEDPNVDIVYVAAPHAHHKPLALTAISAGKHVLVEKPLALTASDATKIQTAASSAGVFAAEAMWTRYLPQFDVLRQVIDRGDLGEIQLATANVGWQIPYDPAARFFAPDAGGGAALDMGVYGFWFAQFAIGRPIEVRAIGTLTDSGVDDQSVTAIAADGGRHASVTVSVKATNTGLGSIVGTAGQASFCDTFVFPGRFAVTTADAVREWTDDSGLMLRQGLAWQATAIADYINDGRTDSVVHSLDEAIAVLETIDTVRRQLEETPRAT